MNRLLIVLALTLLAILLAVSACTLNTAQSVRENDLNATQTAIPLATATDPLAVQQTNPSQPTPVLQSLATSSTCGHLRVVVGTLAGNTLRLRDQPNSGGTIILLIPNNTLVTKVPGSQEVSAGGYTWVNIQYSDPNNVITTGWAAKDAMKNQVTLVAAGC